VNVTFMREKKHEKHTNMEKLSYLVCFFLFIGVLLGNQMHNRKSYPKEKKRASLVYVLPTRINIK